jgi:hypothetical protein
MTETFEHTSAYTKRTENGFEKFVLNAIVGMFAGDQFPISLMSRATGAENPTVRVSGRTK